MAKQVIMVMGVQRSGTTAVFRSLASDQSVTAYDESIDSAVYTKYRLRPLPEIAPLLDAAPDAVLLKPLSETFYRTLENIAGEYARYALRVVWIYRDPVNVLYSMHRQGWLSLSEIAGAVHLDRWNERNRLALQFATTHPEQIALVRYEDCLVDAQVFRRLTGWLGLKSKPLFRKDSTSGRRNIPAAAQQIIDAATRETLSALDELRTFKPGFLGRIKEAATSTNARRGPPRRTRGSEPPAILDLASALSPRGSTEVLPPSGMDGLEFWLDPTALRETELGWRDSGPRQTTAPKVENGPFVIRCLNGRMALAYQPETVTARRAAAPGVLVFGPDSHWAFLLDGGPFSLVALFKPDLPDSHKCNPRRAMLLRVAMAGQTRRSFALEWDSEHAASVATLTLKQEYEEGDKAPVTISTSAMHGSHRHQEWRVVHVQYREDGGAGVLSIETPSSAPNEIPAPTTRRGASQSCELRLGGDPDRPESLFYGAVAEIALFSRGLDANEQDGITRYLVDKYDL